LKEQAIFFVIHQTLFYFQFQAVYKLTYLYLAGSKLRRAERKRFMRITIQWLVLVAGMGLGTRGFGQYGAQYSLYTHERYAFNPAFAGMERSLAASLLYRSQWTGLTGNPESRMLNVNMPVYVWQGAIGFQLYNESIGAENHTAFLASYNYIVESGLGLFSMGLRAGIYQQTLDGTKLRAPDGTYEGSVIDHQDVQLPNAKVSGVAPALEAGVYYAGNAFEAGFSLTGFYPGGIHLDGNIGYNPRPVGHFFGEYFVESWDEVSLYPTVYIKSDLIQTQAEVLLRAEWQNLLSAGIGYRGFGTKNQDAILLSAGVRLSPKFFLYYGYDIGLSHLQVAHEGTHELMIKYNLGEMIGAGLPPRTIYNPRNL
jgi:type IX secretion system PorP/SprF family membrane protein